VGIKRAKQELDANQNTNKIEEEDYRPVSSLSVSSKMLSEKYQPTKLFELIGKHQKNRDIITWLKAHSNKDIKAKHFCYFGDNYDSNVRHSL
jgi:hypothetical protein